MPVIFKIQEGKEITVRPDNNVSSVAAVTSVRNSVADILIAVKTPASFAAGTCLDEYLGVI